MKEFVQVDFKYQGIVATIKLYSKYSRIMGDSGNNKSEFVHYVNKYLVTQDPDFSYYVSNGFDLLCIEPNTDIKLALNVTHTVLLLDDYAMRTATLVNQLLNTNNLFIFVCRSESVCGKVPLIGTYTLSHAGSWFNLRNAELPLYTHNCPVDKILVEAAPNKSEHALLSVYRDDIQSSSGQGNMPKLIKRIKGVKLVLLDLGNIGDILPKLLQYASENSDVYFYNYQAFEELLYKSNLLNRLICETKYNVFTDESLEKYYEHVLAECTLGTAYEYDHDHPVLADPYLDRSNFMNIFDSDVGRALIPLLSNSNSNQFEAVKYLQDKAGDKFKYFTQLQIDSCTTQEDCDELLQSLRWLD